MRDSCGSLQSATAEPGDIYNYMWYIAGLLKELVGSHDNRQLAELADSALQLLPGLTTLDRGKREQRALADQLHSSAIALWNRLGV